MPSAARACAASRADVLALEGDAARRDRMRAGDGAQKRGLAGAVGADQRDRLALLDAEADAAHGLELAVAASSPSTESSVTPRLRRDRPRSRADRPSRFAAAPSAMMRPASMQTRRSATLSRMCTMCSIQTIAMPRRFQFEDDVDQFVRLGVGQAAADLVEQQHGGAGRERAGEFEPLAIDAGRASRRAGWRPPSCRSAQAIRSRRHRRARARGRRHARRR